MTCSARDWQADAFETRLRSLSLSLSHALSLAQYGRETIGSESAHQPSLGLSRRVHGRRSCAAETKAWDRKSAARVRAWVGAHTTLTGKQSLPTNSCTAIRRGPEDGSQQVLLDAGTHDILHTGGDDTETESRHDAVM